MLFNGEEVGDGTGPADRRRRRPDRRHHAHRGRPAERARRDRARPHAARCSSRAPPSTWRRSRPAPEAADAIDIDAPLEENIRAVAKAKGKNPRRSTGHGARPAAARRHDRGPAARSARRVYLITDGDVAGAIVAATPRTQVDLLIGIGGTPEGVIAAAALKCLGGAIQGRLYAAQRRRSASRCSSGGSTSTRVLTIDDLVAGDDVFFAATGITDGLPARGVKYWPRRRDDPLDGDALALRHAPLHRGEHAFEKLERFSPIVYRP